jgi:hypothetical protein
VTTSGVGAERRRLAEADERGVPWRRWGPYLSERQWGTVREDDGSTGDPWTAFTHDQARSRAYRWGEDGIAGWSDDRQQLCLSLALWNGADPVLKERFFGLTNAEGNHGEDVKEYYFFVDATPTHSYLRMVYKYPQRAFPYDDLVTTNAARGREDFEYELLDSGVFEGDRYFDVEVELAKADVDDVVLRITVHNRGPEDAPIRLLPTLWFRNTWSWTVSAVDRPVLRALATTGGWSVTEAAHPVLGSRYLVTDASAALLFTENETNTERLHGTPNAAPYVKDAVDRYVVHGDPAAVNPALVGTKVAADHVLHVPAGGSAVIRVRLTDDPAAALPAGTEPDEVRANWDSVVDGRRAEADEFYAELSPGLAGEEANVVRQALAGLIWSKQYYEYDVARWLEERGQDPLEASGERNGEWSHLPAGDVFSMPDTWEYPWFAAWDLALQAVAASMVDLSFAKAQIELLLSRRYLHPNGQLPAYEWNFSDVNPPVHAWATYFVYQREKFATGRGDTVWLESMFHKLAKNFSWWVNRKDPDGRNVFQGGFLGLDNIGVFDRSKPLPTGGRLDQADGTAWMALFTQNMLQIALELADRSPAYLEQAHTFFEHFTRIARAVNGTGTARCALWDEQDGFFYDVLRLPDGRTEPMAVRSMVGLLPLAAATVIGAPQLARNPQLLDEARRLMSRRGGGEWSLSRSDGGDVLLALFDETQLRRILSRMLDEDEFLSPHGIRSLSRAHRESPYELYVGGERYAVDYVPAESDSGLFGGNSNWRGPVWFPLNAMLIRALLNLHVFYGESFTVELPTGSGARHTLAEVARDLARRLTGIFLPDERGDRPVHGQQATYRDQHWRDLVTFSEYFHGDNGAGIGASHQTGWTALVAGLPGIFAHASPDELARQGLLPGRLGVVAAWPERSGPHAA